jgi:hypothetical protein
MTSPSDHIRTLKMVEINGKQVPFNVPPNRLDMSNKQQDPMRGWSNIATTHNNSPGMVELMLRQRTQPIGEPKTMTNETQPRFHVAKTFSIVLESGKEVFLTREADELQFSEDASGKTPYEEGFSPKDCALLARAFLHYSKAGNLDTFNPEAVTR